MVDRVRTSGRVDKFCLTLSTVVGTYAVSTPPPPLPLFDLRYHNIYGIMNTGTLTGKKIVFRTLGFTLSTLGSVPSNVFKVPKTTVNTFDGTDPKVDRIKPKVRNTIFFSCDCPSVMCYKVMKAISKSLSLHKYMCKSSLCVPYPCLCFCLAFFHHC